LAKLHSAAMSTQALPPIPSDIVVLTGPLLVAYLISWGLFGALSVQVYYYYLSFPKDPLKHKLIVAFTYTLEVLQLIISTHDAFRALGRGWGNMIELDKDGLLWLGSSVFGALIEANAQVFYAWRIWVLSGHRKAIPLVIMLLTTLQLGASLYCGAAMAINGHLSQLQDHFYKMTSVWLMSSAACDILIAASMSYYLRSTRVANKATNAIMSRLFSVTIETGLICAVFAIIDLSLFLAFEYNNIHLPLCMALSKLYSNSLLMVMNTRIKIVGGRVPWEDDEAVTSSGLSLVKCGSNSRARPSTPAFIQNVAAPRSINAQSGAFAVALDQPDPFDASPMEKGGFYLSRSESADTSGSSVS